MCTGERGTHHGAAAARAWLHLHLPHLPAVPCSVPLRRTHAPNPLPGAGNNSGGLPRPGGLPGNLAVDGGSNYVRTSPPPPSPANSGGNVAAAGAKPTQTQPVKKAASVRRPQNTRKNPPPAKAP